MFENSGMELKEAIRIAKLWKAGKMIGYQEDEVTVPLLNEIERIREAIFPIMVDMKGQIEHCHNHGDNWEADFLDKYFSKLAAIFPDLFITSGVDVAADRFSVEVKRWHDA
ncbi:hypothetical protein [Teredinibacter purpureus]|uniref:hypothetical protein n=1 Tax=Teredinibacter purpureus TaxID=2731756 RepID=UPI0005F7DD04|nr:hypothetical protein [Teredinibacter purpureus]